MDPLEIFTILRRQIIWLDLQPETTLNVSELAESFGVSRYPITIALTRLEVEGWIMRNGTRYMVSPLRLTRIKEITEIRLILEVQANVVAMQRITPSEMNELLELKQSICDLDGATSNRQVVELDEKLHVKIFSFTKNSLLIYQLRQLLSHYLRFWLSISRQIERDSFVSGALGFITAIENKDKSKLLAVSTKHIQASIDEILRTF